MQVMVQLISSGHNFRKLYKLLNESNKNGFKLLNNYLKYKIKYSYSFVFFLYFFLFKINILKKRGCLSY